MADQDPRDRQGIPSAGFETSASSHQPLMASPLGAGEAQTQIFGGYVTAQVVQLPRVHSTIMTRIKQMGMMGGERFYYAWDVTDKRGKKSEVAGLGIKGSNALAMVFGNCNTDVRVVDAGEHYIFYARFVDLETGYSDIRPFRQRKKMNFGKMDADRAEDIAFQIGASKAKRNVVNNALDVYAQEMLEWARKGVIERITQNRPKAEAWIMETAEKHEISLKRLELYIGRAQSEWAVPHLAKLFGALQAVDEGMETASNVFHEGAMPEGSVNISGKVEEKQQAADTKQADKPKDAEAAKGRQSNRKPAEQKPADQKAAAEPEKKAEPPKEEAKPNEPGVSDADLEQLAGWGNEGEQE